VNSEHGRDRAGNTGLSSSRVTPVCDIHRPLSAPSHAGFHIGRFFALTEAAVIKAFFSTISQGKIEK
jgi:hypothetical protein